MFLANIGRWVRLKNHNRLNSNKKSTSSCFPSLMAILSFFIDSKVSILLLDLVRLANQKSFDFRCLVTHGIIKICGNSRNNEHPVNSKPFERDTNFETEEDVRGPFILEEVGTTVAVKRSKISLWAIVRIKIEETSGWLFLTSEFLSFVGRRNKNGKNCREWIENKSEPKNFYSYKGISCKKNLLKQIGLFIVDISA